MNTLLGKDDRCSVARSLEVLGEKWTLLIVRETFLGRSRFSEIQSSLGIAKDVLTNRLAGLVEHGVLERRTYREEGARERYEYALTPVGHDLAHVMAALSQWGDRYRPTEAGPSRVYIEVATGEPVSVGYTSADGRALSAAEVTVVPGPGA